MSADVVSKVIGEDGVKVAAQALKDIAANEREPADVRVNAAGLLLSYGFAA